MKYDNPFPGMNPYLESPDIWPDFHNGLIGQLRTFWDRSLPDNYRIALERRVEVEEPFGVPSELNLVIPDALVPERIRSDAASQGGGGSRCCGSPGRSGGGQSANAS